MASQDILSRLKQNGWRNIGKVYGRHAHLVHPDRHGVITLPSSSVPGTHAASSSRPAIDAAMAILSRRNLAMPCYYATFLPEQQGFSVLFPDIPGCQTHGATPSEAFAMAVDALSGHLEALAANNETLPVPSDAVSAFAHLQAMCAEYGIILPEHFAATSLQLIPALEQDSTLVRVSVSFRRSALTMIDRKAEAAGMTRSGFLAAAAASYVIEREDRKGPLPKTVLR